MRKPTKSLATKVILVFFGLFLTSGQSLANPTPPTLAELLKAPGFGMPTLSPNGRYLAGLRQQVTGGTFNLVTADLDQENTVLSTTPLDVLNVY